MSAGTRLSGLQKEVLNLYRAILRAAVKKDRQEFAADNELPSVLSLLQRKQVDASSRSTSTSYASAEFRRQAAQVRRSDFKTIEYKIRKGQKQLKLLQMPGVRDVKGTS